MEDIFLVFTSLLSWNIFVFFVFQSLMQRQRELETFSPTDLEKQNNYVS